MLVLIFAFFLKIFIYVKLEEIVMNVINGSELAKFNTSKIDGTSKPQTNLPVKICHSKVVCLVDVCFVQARVVHMPGMDEEPSSTFSNMATLFSKLNISLDSVDGEETNQEPSHQEVAPPTQEAVALTYEDRAALRKAEREKKRTSDDPSGNGYVILSQ